MYTKLFYRYLLVDVKRIATDKPRPTGLLAIRLATLRLILNVPL